MGSSWWRLAKMRLLFIIGFLLIGLTLFLECFGDFGGNNNGMENKEWNKKLVDEKENLLERSFIGREDLGFRVKRDEPSKKNLKKKKKNNKKRKGKTSKRKEKKRKNKKRKQKGKNKRGKKNSMKKKKGNKKKKESKVEKKEKKRQKKNKGTGKKKAGNKKN